MTDPKAPPSLGYSFQPQYVMNVDFLTCHSNTAPTVLRPMRQTENQPNDQYFCKLGLEPGSMHSPKSQVQYSIDCAKPAQSYRLCANVVQPIRRTAIIIKH